MATTFAGRKLAEVGVYWVGGWLAQQTPAGAMRTASIRGQAGIPVPIHDPALRRLYFTGRYEDEVQDMARAILRPGDIAIDVGANIGVHTLYFASLVGPQGRIHAFEPVPESAAMIRQAIASNGLSARIRLNQIALSDAPGAATFFVSAGIASTSSLTRYPWLAEAASIRVQMTTLDDYAERLSATTRLLKIDVEGGELGVLIGGRRLLQERPPDFVILEFTSANDARELLAHLLRLGYKQVRLGGGNFHTVEPSAPNPSKGSPGDSNFIVQNACFRHTSTASLNGEAA